MKVLVHTANLMGEVEDPELYAAQPLWEWQQTDVGQWVMAHSKPEPYFTIGISVETYGYNIKIIANLEDTDLTYFNLKWGCK
jgi:hypothetical protein